MNRRANGAAIFAIRQALGIRQGAMAAQAGISGPYLSQIENGVREPGMEVLRALATGLGVTVDAISYPVCEQHTDASAAGIPA